MTTPAGDLTIALCDQPGHVGHAARITVTSPETACITSAISFCLTPEHAGFLRSCLASVVPRTEPGLEFPGMSALDPGQGTGYTTLAGGRDALGQPWEIGVRLRGMVIALPGATVTVPGPEDGSAAVIPAGLLFDYGPDRDHFAEAVARASTPNAGEVPA